ncbi:unnamed protein product, partial [Meganyctiphanes norvegica]
SLQVPYHSSKYITSHRNDQMLFFNRVPKTGSEMLVLLLQWLQGDNSFRHVRLKNSVKRHLSFEQQLEVAAEIGETVHESKERLLSFDRHIHFTNFTQLGLKVPIFINIIRDPIEKLESRFYYARATPRPGGLTPPGGYIAREPPKYATLEDCVRGGGHECTFIHGKHYDLAIPYFCGHEKFCRELNNEQALAIAKRNVEEWYPVVGILEEVNQTLAVLEHTIPQFFKGVTNLYFNELMAPHHNANRQRPHKEEPSIESELQRNLTLEYDFYYFIRQRLKEQFQQITNTQHTTAL